MPCLSARSTRRRWVEKFASFWIGRTPQRVKPSTGNGRRDARLCHLEPPGLLGGFFLVPGNAWLLSRVCEVAGIVLGVVAERSLMDRKADDYWGTLLLAMAQDAREDGDLLTAEVLFAEAMRYFDEENRLAERWRNFEARLDGEPSRRRRKAA